MWYGVMCVALGGAYVYMWWGWEGCVSTRYHIDMIRLHCWIDRISGLPQKAQEHIKILGIFNVATKPVLVFSNC